MSLEVANTILQQLGGRRFVMMTGARNLVGSPDALSFRMPRVGTDGSNAWRITLMPSDTYKVTTAFVRGGKMFPKSTFDDIYCDGLVELFERVSGFVTKL